MDVMDTELNVIHFGTTCRRLQPTLHFIPKEIASPLPRLKLLKGRVLGHV
jgi:hypothetical protein